MRYDLVRMLVLNEIADDYEEAGHIHHLLEGLSRQYGLPIELSDVKHALVDLVALGWAKAYDLEKEPVEELQGPPPAESDSCYYWITQLGREVKSSFDGWPFDEEGAMRPGWSPPAE